MSDPTNDPAQTPTPETDARARHSQISIGVTPVVSADFARTLERQRDAFKDALDFCFTERDSALAKLAEAEARYQWAFDCYLMLADSEIEEIRDNNNLRSKLAELKSDKERLDWLESQGTITLELRGTRGNRWTIGDDEDATTYDGLRSAIDAALASRPKGETLPEEGN